MLLNLNNVHRVCALENSEPTLGITRSPLKVIELAGLGITNVVAFFGDVPSPTQCERIEALLDSYHYEGIAYYTSWEDKPEHIGLTVQLIESPRMWFFK